MSANIRNKVLIIFAHPALYKSRINMELVKEVEGLDGVTFRDLYDEYPDFLIDVKKEQESLRENDLLVLLHPFYWYGCPAIVKEWVDLVLEYGFAYGRGGDALIGKKIMSAIATGGTEDDYKRDGMHYYSVREFLNPFERTATFCGMQYLPPFVVHGAINMKMEDIAVYKSLFGQIIKALRDGEMDLAELQGFKYINDYFLEKYKSWSI